MEFIAWLPKSNSILSFLPAHAFAISSHLKLSSAKKIKNTLTPKHNGKLFRESELASKHYAMWETYGLVCILTAGILWAGQLNKALCVDDAWKGHLPTLVPSSHHPLSCWGSVVCTLLPLTLRSPGVKGREAAEAAALSTEYMFPTPSALRNLRCPWKKRKKMAEKNSRNKIAEQMPALQCRRLILISQFGLLF